MTIQCHEASQQGKYSLKAMDAVCPEIISLVERRRHRSEDQKQKTGSFLWPSTGKFLSSVAEMFSSPRSFKGSFLFLLFLFDLSFAFQHLHASGNAVSQSVQTVVTRQAAEAVEA